MAKKHTSVEVKLEAALQILDGKKSVIEVADDLNLHRDTVNNWVNIYKDKGEHGFINPYSHRSSQTTMKINFSNYKKRQHQRRPF